MVPWVLSGASAQALAAQADRLASHLRAYPALDVVDVGVSLARRPAFEHRAVVLGAERAQLLAGLDALARGERVDGVPGGSVRRESIVAGQVAVRAGTGVAFLFPGQGSQWVGIGDLAAGCVAALRRTAAFL